MKTRHYVVGLALATSVAGCSLPWGRAAKCVADLLLPELRCTLENYDAPVDDIMRVCGLAPEKREPVERVQAAQRDAHSARVRAGKAP